MLERLEKAKIAARNISEALIGLTKGPIQVDGELIKETDQAWKKNNRTAANTIDSILKDVNTIDSKQLSAADLEKLTFGLENISENFRFNTEKNRRTDTKAPGYVWSPETDKAYREALANNSVSNLYITSLDVVAALSKKIAEANQAQIEKPAKTNPEVAYENEEEIVFEDFDKKPAPAPTYLEKKEAMNRTLKEVEERYEQKKAAESPQKPVEQTLQSIRERERDYTVNPVTPLEQAEEKFQSARQGLNFYSTNQKLSEYDRQNAKELLKKADAIVAEGAQIDPKDTLPIEQHVRRVENATRSINSATVYLTSKLTAARLSNEPQEPDSIRDFSRSTETSTATHKSSATDNKADLKAKLDDAEATADAAFWGMFGSGGVLGSAAVVGAVFFGLGVALGPIGWGILGAVAVLGLGGLIASAIMGDSAEKEADDIELQIEEFSPDGGGYDDVSHRGIEQPKQHATAHQASSESPSVPKEPAGRPPVETPGARM